MSSRGLVVRAIDEQSRSSKFESTRVPHAVEQFLFQFFVRGHNLSLTNILLFSLLIILNLLVLLLLIILLNRKL